MFEKLNDGSPNSSFSPEAHKFVEEFSTEKKRPKFVLGRNVYTNSVVQNYAVDGIVDDFTDESEYLGLPIVRAADLPNDALVLNASGGRPLSAKQRLDSFGLKNLDYFAFYKLAQKPLTEMRFNEGFEQEFAKNRNEFEAIFGKLGDHESQLIFDKLMKFRFTYDVSHLEGFSHRESEQYFEDFLELSSHGETFVDVGCFDGYTSREFIRLCPDYRSVHAFEPDPVNFQLCKSALSNFRNTHCYPFGLSDHKGELSFDVSGSASKIAVDGNVRIMVERLDDIVRDDPTLIKMDIEGGESAAISGARQTILDAHPRLAICVYHHPNDFWQLPKQILDIRDDYELRLRHYTETIYETVMFFLPKK